ncbi:MAG: hypothetical protein EZS28_028185 [Streblomastix strix]|uniref:Uncharacterized protein n=1 Tax=Streblomastix strix TaxID=222440 RepID=A0A5J4V0N7_9EUKA|nr:MAG: hypothetical protein EZS28_028185 [Streblomastix strix]
MNYKLQRNLRLSDVEIADDSITKTFEDDAGYFGSPTADSLNVFDKQGLSVYDLIIRDNIGAFTAFGQPGTNLYEFYNTRIYEFQAAVLAAYYGLNVKPSSLHYLECGVEYFMYEGVDSSNSSVGNIKWHYPIFALGVNDQNCYGTTASTDSQCREKCTNNIDLLEAGTYGKDLLTYDSPTDVIDTEQKLKRRLANFGSILESCNKDQNFNICYGWVKDGEGTKFLKVFRYQNGTMVLFNESFSPFGIYYFAYIDPFPAKATAYTPTPADIPLCATDTLPTPDGCICTKDNHPTGCLFPVVTIGIPKAICAAGVVHIAWMIAMIAVVVPMLALFW